MAVTLTTYRDGNRLDTRTSTVDEAHEYLRSNPGLEYQSTLGAERKYSDGDITVYVTGLD